GNSLFDVLDRHRVAVNREDAGSFAGSGADAAGKFREVVGCVEGGKGPLPLAAIDEVVPVRDQISERAALMTERHGAIHTTAALGAGVLFSQVEMDLLLIADR